MVRVASISQQIWDMKYRLKDADGQPVDKTMADTWSRVAGALAAPEKDAKAWETKFFDAMADFRLLPAGRILSGARADRRVTLFNCFVMGDIPDDMSGIFEHLKEAALTMQQGGGIGYDFSTLRPKGARVQGIGADASGPLSFMDVWDAMCLTIMSAGKRRGAMMGVLACDHPDIEAFVEAKRRPGRLRMFNLSVLITDAFMRAVKEDAAWELTFDGVVYKSLPARALWDKITRATYAYAEPGVVFIDRINRMNPLSYCETIHGTNPCITADTWVHTTEGPRRVADLIGRPFSAVVHGKPCRSGPAGFFRTGSKKVVRLTTREGYSLRLTADHRVRRAASRTRTRVSREWVKAGDLREGDEIVLHDHRRRTDWPGLHGDDEGYLIGLLLGDGTLMADRAVLSAWPGRIAVNGGVPRPGALAIMARAEIAARKLPHRADFQGWAEVAGRGEYRLRLAALNRLARRLGLRPGQKAVSPEIESASSDFYRGFLRGFFDSDGSVQGTQQKGVSVRLAQSDLARLQAVQRMLSRLGIVSTLYRERRPAGHQILPDGRGGKRAYATAANHELVIAKENVVRFSEIIGFADSEKRTRLTALVSAYRRRPNRERFLARVAAIIEEGAEDVYDVQVPGVNAFDANGIEVHNCGEQPLPPYGACLLGSVNLARLIERPFERDAALDLDALGALVTTAVRMLDNVIEVSRFPLPQHEREAKSKRRIGLGITGLADALIFCGARYGDGRAVGLTKTWMKAIQRAAYLASSELAAEKGSFPLFDKVQYLAGPAIRRLDDDIRAAIAEHGIRNALLTSVAPTGTISLLADNVSSGLEPVFSFEYTRHLRGADGTPRTEEVSDYAYRLFRRRFGNTVALPEYFVDAQGLSPADHLVMQAAVQEFVDSSISKTINCPESISFDDFKDIYTQAFDLGCKGCTTYRPNLITGAVLETRDGTKAANDQPELPLEQPRKGTTTRTMTRTKPEDLGDSGAVVHMFQPLDRPEALTGGTYKVRWPESDHAFYITINDIVQDGRRRPFEVFINSKNMEHYAWTVALTRMISAVFRRGGDVSFVVEELKAVFDPRGGQWVGGRYVPSLLAAIGGAIEQHMIEIGFLSAPGEASEAVRQVLTMAAGPGSPEGSQGDGGAPTDRRFRQCPKCGQPSLIHQEGCDTCTGCGYSKCS